MELTVSTFKPILFMRARSFKTTSSLDEDIKLIKKINTLLSKWKRTDDERYHKEINNSLLILNNIFALDQIIRDHIAQLFIVEDNRTNFITLFNRLFA